MYMSEISKSKVSGLKAQKMIILLTLKHVSAVSEHPVYMWAKIQAAIRVIMNVHKKVKYFF